MPKTCAIIPAAGRGLRMGVAKPKQFLEIAGKPVLLHTLETLSRAHFLSLILVVVQNDFLKETEGLLRGHCSNESNRFRYVWKEPFPCGPKIPACQGISDEAGMEIPGGAVCRAISLVPGGVERQDSVFNALQELPADCEWVLIHDGVRPFVSLELLENTWRTAQETGAAIAALPATDTIKRVRKEVVIETVRREEIWLAQTPQVFRKDIILSAYQAARKHNWAGTDDAFFVERLGLPVAVVRGERSNIKITTPEDVKWGNWLALRGPSGSVSCE